ncbi:MAG: hypothetical protein NVS3B26_05080 [Mycobacteriales bacterium]
MLSGACALAPRWAKPRGPLTIRSCQPLFVCDRPPMALTSAPGTHITVLATALGVSILLDATIVRALLVGLPVTVD